MWKKIVLRIWMENKGISLCWKIPVLFLMIAAGISGFSYIVVLVCTVPFIECASLPISYMEDLLPRTAGERKKMDMVESALIAGIYTLAFILGNALAFGLSGKYSWDRDTYVFLVRATLFVFLVLFGSRMWCIQTIILGTDTLFLAGVQGRARDRKEKRFVVDILVSLYCFGGPLLYILFYGLGKFGGAAFLHFLTVSKISLAAESIFFAALCAQTARIWRRGYESL